MILLTLHAHVCAVMFLLNVYQGKVDPSFVPNLLPHMLGAVTLSGGRPPRAGLHMWPAQVGWQGCIRPAAAAASCWPELQRPQRPAQRDARCAQ